MEGYSMKEKIIPVYKINFNKYNFTEASLFTVIKDTELITELEKHIINPKINKHTYKYVVGKRKYSISLVIIKFHKENEVFLRLSFEQVDPVDYDKIKFDNCFINILNVLCSSNKEIKFMFRAKAVADSSIMKLLPINFGYGEYNQIRGVTLTKVLDNNISAKNLLELSDDGEKLTSEVQYMVDCTCSSDLFISLFLRAKELSLL